MPEEPDAEWTAALRADVTALRRRARHLVARSALAGDAPAADDVATAERAARRAVAEDPLDEDAVQLLLRALLLRGLPAEALRVYEALRRGLADELGADPGPVTQELHAAALGGRCCPGGLAPVAGPSSGSRPDGTARIVRRVTVWPQAAAVAAAASPPARVRGIGRVPPLGGAARAWPRAVAGRCFPVGRPQGSGCCSPSRSRTCSPRRSAPVPVDRVRRAVEGLGVLGRLVPDLARLTGGATPGPRRRPWKRPETAAACRAFLAGPGRGGAGAARGGRPAACWLLDRRAAGLPAGYLTGEHVLIAAPVCWVRG